MDTKVAVNFDITSEFLGAGNVALKRTYPIAVSGKYFSASA